MLSGGNRVVQGAWQIPSSQAEALHAKTWGDGPHISTTLSHTGLKAPFLTR